MHVLLFQLLDRVPIERQLFGQVLDRGAATAPTDVVGEALRVERIVAEKVEPLALHGATSPAVDTPDLQLEIDAVIARRQIAHPPRASVVPTAVRSSADAAQRFFERRTSVTMRAFGSPKTPRTLRRARNPGKEYASVRRRARLRFLAIAKACQVFASYQDPENSHAMRVSRPS